MNFSVFSKHATEVALLLFDRVDDAKAARVIPLDPEGRSLAELRQEGLCVYLILNAYWESLDFELPPGDGDVPSGWRRWIDTSLESPQDIVPWQTAPALPGPRYRVAARSLVVLFGTNQPGG